MKPDLIAYAPRGLSREEAAPADDSPITLAEAAAGFFGGRVTAASLRAESRRGRLRVFRVGNKDFTTVADLQQMMEQCRVVPPARASISILSASNGPSETEIASSARAAALETAAMLNPRSRSISAGSTHRNQAVTR
jgi:hypothetical protein